MACTETQKETQSLNADASGQEAPVGSEKTEHVAVSLSWKQIPRRAKAGRRPYFLCDVRS